MTLETLKAVTELLSTKYDIPASFEYPGFIEIPLESAQVAYGDANEYYGASVTDMDGNDLGAITTRVPSDSDDVARIAAVTADTYRKYAGVDHVRFTGHDIEFPKWLRDLKFEDESWKNDAMAKACLYLNASEYECVRVWVDYADPCSREYGEDAPLYTVEYCNGHDEYHCDGTELYRGDSAQDAKDAIDTCVADKVGDIDTRIERTAEHAMDAFWAVVAKRFPEATSGDFDPTSSLVFRRQCVSVIRLWLMFNAPELKVGE